MNIFQYKNLKQKNYFEGWYFRFTDAVSKINYAVIFAITRNSEDPHAFLQVFNDQTKTNQYIRYDVSEFQYDYEVEKLTIGKSSLSTTECNIDTEPLKMNLRFKNTISLKDVSNQ